MLRVLRGVAATEVYLDEIEAAFLKVEVGVVLVVVVKAYVDAQFVAIVHIAAGVGTGIAVDTSFQPLGMDVVGHGLQAVGETLGMNEELARFHIAPAKETVVDVDVVVAHSIQAF